MGHTGKHNFDHFDSNMRRTPEHREGTMDDVPIAISKVDGSPVVEVSTALNGVRNEEEGFLDDNSLLGRRWMCTVVVAGVIMVIAGTVDVQLITLMNRQQLPPCENCEIRYFEAPFFQTWLVHVAGEPNSSRICFGTYRLTRRLIGTLISFCMHHSRCWDVVC